jgi:hypothetical protein
MKQSLLLDKYPVYSLEIAKDETTFESADAIINYLQSKIAAHPFAVEIAVFDHYTHTTGIEDHTIDPNIKAALNIVFCFGKMLPKPTMLAVRPRSIGVCELQDHFEISFLEVPNEKLHEVTEGWAKSIKNK